MGWTLELIFPGISRRQILTVPSILNSKNFYSPVNTILVNTKTKKLFLSLWVEKPKFDTMPPGALARNRSFAVKRKIDSTDLSQ